MKKSVQKIPKKKGFDLRRFNGGKRPGAGRPPDPRNFLKGTYWGEKVEVRFFKSGQTHYKKVPRIQLALDTLYEQAASGNLRAINKYLNLALGKPKKAERVVLAPGRPFRILVKIDKAAEKPIGGPYELVIPERISRLEGSEKIAAIGQKIVNDFNRAASIRSSNISEQIFKSKIRRDLNL